MSENQEVIVAEDGSIVGEVDPKSTPRDTEEIIEDKHLSDSNPEPDALDTDSDPDSDLRDGDGNTDAERESIRERRRQERADKKHRQRERESNLRSELASRDAAIAEMREQLDAINRRNVGSELAQLKTAKEQSVGAYNHFKRQVQLATEANDGATLTDAIEKMQMAQRRFEELNRIEQAYNKQRSAPAPLDPRLKQHAERWMGANKWYDPTGADEDSELMLTIDQRMAREGWDPKTPEYWDELTKRAQKRLPHRFQAPRTQPRSVVSGANQDAGPASGGTGYKLSAERVQALKDAGMWTDPSKRAEAIKRYKAYDKQNQS